MIRKIIDKSLEDETLTSEEIAKLFKTPFLSDESALIMAAGRRKAEKAARGKAEVHAQVGLNIAPCPRDCQFCAFAGCNGLFKESSALTVEEVVERAEVFENDGANAIYFMATADYPFSRFIEYGREIRKQLKPETIIVANVGDFSAKQAGEMRDAGFSGIYHAVRLREGVDTKIPPENRLESFRNAKHAGLKLGTCLEPVGPEHTVEELVEKTLITRDAEPVYSGSARRIFLPGTEIEKRGVVSEGRMGLYVAIVRLALPCSVPGNCTHEPNKIGTMSGASLLWAESGSNPRDTEENTEGKRGMTVGECRRIFEEAEFEVLNGPSKYFS